jgi:hypothetical protein
VPKRLNDLRLSTVIDSGNQILANSKIKKRKDKTKERKRKEKGKEKKKEKKRKETKRKEKCESKRQKLIYK